MKRCLPLLRPKPWHERHYALIGKEYYDPAHVTCRNFDALVDNFLAKHPLNLQQGCRYLEVGCGRSRLVQYRRAGAEIVLLDICHDMLEHTLRSGGAVGSVSLASAFALPFDAQRFEVVFAFLGDPYLHPQYLAEVRRVLRPGGKISQIVPSYDWGATLRSSRQGSLHYSHFFRGKREAFGPSFLLTKADLVEMLREAGFINIALTDLFLPVTVREECVSPDIDEPAMMLGLSPYKLPILTAFEASAI